MTIIFYEKKKYNLSKCKHCKKLYPYSVRTNVAVCVECRFKGYKKTVILFQTPTDKFNKAFNNLTQNFKIDNDQLFYNFCTYIDIEKYHEIAGLKTLYQSIKYSMVLLLYIYDLVYHVYKIDEKKLSAYFSKYGIPYKAFKKKCYDKFVKILEKANRLIIVPSRSDLIKYYLKHFSNPLGAAGLYKTPTSMFEKYKIDFPNADEKTVAMTYMLYYRKRIKLIRRLDIKTMQKLAGSLMFKKYEKQLYEQISKNYDDFEH